MKNRTSIISALCVMAVSIVFFVYSLMYPYRGEDIGPGPGFLPFWLSLILFVLSLSYLYVAVKGEDSVEAMPDRQGKKNIIGILLYMIAFLAVLPWVGFNVASSVFLFVLFIKSYKWHISLLTAVGTSIILFVLFNNFLQVNLPVNMFGF